MVPPPIKHHVKTAHECSTVSPDRGTYILLAWYWPKQEPIYTALHYWYIILGQCLVFRFLDLLGYREVEEVEMTRRVKLK